MKVTTETVAPREVVLTIEPDEQTIQRAMRRAARELSRYRPIAGFRPGRAPYAMVERVFGHEAILNEALNAIAPDLYRDAIEEAEIEPLEQGMLDIESQDPLVLKVTVPLVPTVTLGDYSELTIEPEPEVAVSEKDIDAQIEMLRRQHAEVESAERPLQMGDQVVAAITGTVDGEEVQRQDNATLDVTEELNPPGFAEALLGAEVNEIRNFSLTYPDDHENEELAGKTVDYQVAIGAIQELNLPDVDDEFAKTVGDFETLADLRDQIAENLQAQGEQDAFNTERGRALEALISISEVEYPEAAVEHEVDHLVDSQRQQMQQMGFSLENYLRITGETEESLRAQVREPAESGLVQRLVIIEYSQKEDLQLTEEEMNEAITSFANNLMATYGEQGQEMVQQALQGGTISRILQDALLRKAAIHLTDRLAGREVEVPEEESTEPEASEAVEQENAEQEGEVQEGSDQS